MTDEIGTWYWHLHHDLLCEPLTEPLQNRVDYIATNKPESERETRLRLVAPVTVALPEPFVKAAAAYDKTWAAYVKARAAYDKALAAYVKARAAYDKARDASDKARDAYVKAWAAYDKARAASDKARDAYDKELEALHVIDCPAAVAGTCPWDGATIFPKVAA